MLLHPPHRSTAINYTAPSPHPRLWRNLRHFPQTQKTPSKQANKQASKQSIISLTFTDVRSYFWQLQLATYTTITTTTTTCFATSSTTSSSHVTATPFQHALRQAYMPPHFTHFPHCKPVAKQARKQARQPTSKLLTAKPLSRSAADSRHTVCQPPHPGALNFHCAVSTQGRAAGLIRQSFD